MKCLFFIEKEGTLLSPGWMLSVHFAYCNEISELFNLGFFRLQSAHFLLIKLSTEQAAAGSLDRKRKEEWDWEKLHIFGMKKIRLWLLNKLNSFSLGRDAIRNSKNCFHFIYLLALTNYRMALDMACSNSIKKYKLFPFHLRMTFVHFIYLISKVDAGCFRF